MQAPSGRLCLVFLAGTLSWPGSGKPGPNDEGGLPRL